MKKLTSLILLFAILTFNFSKVILWGYYELNKAEITELYCINKDKPMMHCCGKCMLKKKFAQDDAHKNSPAMNDLKFDITFFSAIANQEVLNYANTFSLINSFYGNVYLPGVHSSVFHPPCC